MLDVHSRIHEVKKTVVRDYESTKPQPFDPIPPVARSISNNSWLICFDEFQVSNNNQAIRLFLQCSLDILVFSDLGNFVAFENWHNQF
jgi:predicted ATPase